MKFGAGEEVRVEFAELGSGGGSYVVHGPVDTATSAWDGLGEGFMNDFDEDNLEDFMDDSTDDVDVAPEEVS